MKEAGARGRDCVHRSGAAASEGDVVKQRRGRNLVGLQNGRLKRTSYSDCSVRRKHRASHRKFFEPRLSPLVISSACRPLVATGNVYSIRVRVDISHYSINNLVVTLTSPGGTTVTLHNRSGGTADDLVGSWPDFLTEDGPGTLGDFHGEDIQGTWILNVSDHQFGAIGTVISWGLTMEVTSFDPTPVGDSPARTTRMLGNVPNPFNPRTVIAFELARSTQVRLDIYDLKGRLVRTLVDGDLPAGRHQVAWDGKDQRGKASASGVYFTKLRSGGTDHIRKMTLVR